MGRPTKYSEEILQQAEEYIASCVDKLERVVIGVDSKGKDLFTYKMVVRFPTAEGLANHLKVSRSTLYNWANKNKEFLDILEAINQEQVKRLIDKGLSGEYNSNIARLVLAKHGYKAEMDITTDGQKITGINLVKPDGKPIGESD